MAATTPKAIDDCHELLLWIIPQLDKFPRDRRFTLGERIETGVLDVLEALTAAAYGQDKRPWLDQANRRINTVRHLWRVAHELRTLPTRQYEYGSQRIVALGAQIGGWRKHSGGGAAPMPLS